MLRPKRDRVRFGAEGVGSVGVAAVMKRRPELQAFSVPAQNGVHVVLDLCDPLGAHLARIIDPEDRAPHILREYEPIAVSVTLDQEAALQLFSPASDVAEALKRSVPQGFRRVVVVTHGLITVETVA